MLNRLYHRVFSRLLIAGTVLAVAACSHSGELIARYTAQAGEPAARILFVAGRDSHGPSAHEHRAGSELLAALLHQRNPDYSIDVVYGGWPEDTALADGVDALVMYCDGGRGHVINEHLEQFNRLLDDRVGVVALHYAVEVPKGSASADAMLRATGGYFETDWSVNPHWEAHFESLPQHPVTEGVQPFVMLDEWYFNMRFQPQMAGLIPMLSAVPPAATMSRADGPHSGNPAVRKLVAAGVPQVVAWGYKRPQGGRGFGYTGGHFHANWENANTRQLVLNAIEWTVRGGVYEEEESVVSSSN